MAKGRAYRDTVYIVKDVILTLSEYGRLNQTSLISFCGLNLKKHRHILDELEKHEMVSKVEETLGKRTVTYYSATQKGIEFSRTILSAYEDIFPRKTKEGKDHSKMSLLLLV